MSRIYKGGEADNRYRQTDKSVGYAPVTAVSSANEVQGYAKALADDAATMGRELARQQQADNLALQAQQSTAASQLSVNQSRERGELSLQQGYENAKREFDSIQLSLEADELRARQSVDSAKTKLIGDTIQGLLSFGGSYLQYQSEMSGIRKKEALEREKQQLNDDIYRSFTGFEDGKLSVSPSRIEESQVRDQITTANAQAQLGTADTLIDSKDPTEAAAGIKMSQSTIWQQLSGVRGRMYDARTQYPVALQQAIDEGLIRPTAQGGVDDLKEFNKRFLEATGLLNEGVDKARLAEIVLVPSLATATNSLASIDSKYRAGVIAANQVETKSRITSLALGSSPGNVISQFETAQLETAQTQLGFQNGGKVNRRTTAFTLAEFLTTLQTEGAVEAIRALGEHAPNPNTPNIKLKDTYAALFREAERGALKQVIGANDTANLIDTVTKNDLRSAYLRDPNNEENRNKYLAWLSRPGASERDLSEYNDFRNRAAKSSVSLHAQWLENARAGFFPSEDELQEARLNGLSSEDYTYWKTRTKEAIKKEVLQPATAGLRDSIRSVMVSSAGQKSNLTPEALASLNPRINAAQAKIEETLGIRIMQDESLRNDPARLSNLVEQTTRQVLSAPEFQASWDGNTARFNFQKPLQLRSIPITNGKEDFRTLTAKQIFIDLKVPASQLNPTTDIFIDTQTLKTEAKALLDGNMSAVSRRTRDLARALNIPTKGLIDAQLKVAGMGGLGEYKTFLETGSNYETPAQRNLPTTEELQRMYPSFSSSTAPINTPAGNGKNRTIQVGRQLLSEGYVIWQHPNFDYEKGYVPEGGQRVMRRTYDSPHHHGEALDLPLSHNSEARLDALARRLRANPQRYGITQVLWKEKDHYDHLHITFAP